MRRAQGWYYLIGGLWPFLHWRSFTAVAGPKPDRFQTEITAGLFSAIGYALLKSDDEDLAWSSALACIALDTRFKEEIRPVFQFDRALNLLFMVEGIRKARRAAGIPTAPLD